MTPFQFEHELCHGTTAGSHQEKTPGKTFAQSSEPTVFFQLAARLINLLPQQKHINLYSAMRMNADFGRGGGWGEGGGEAGVPYLMNKTPLLYFSTLSLTKSVPLLKSDESVNDRPKLIYFY